MNIKDFDKFALAWRATNEYYNQPVTDGSLALSFKNLDKYELADIEEAINRHIQDTENGRFSPKVADIIKHIESLNPDGRIGSDEAWAIAMKSFDEYATVVMNDEIAGALGSARYIFEAGDKVGARMAFKAAYDRLVRESRDNGKVVKWWPSFGFDASMREVGVQDAIDIGRLTTDTLRVVGIPYTPDSEVLKIVKKAMPQIPHDALAELRKFTGG